MPLISYQTCQNTSALVISFSSLPEEKNSASALRPGPGDRYISNVAVERIMSWLKRTIWIPALIILPAFLPSHTSAGGPQELPPLSTEAGAPRLSGKFVWADLVTDDVVAARKFYGALFGWTFTSAGDYTIAANDERPLCGMFQRQRPADRPEARPRWFGYISVPNVKRAQKAVIESGGKVLVAPRKMPKRGEQAVFSDPEGAAFGVVKSSSGDPQDFLADPGDWIWIELLSRDGAKAADFYHNVVGYQVIENSATNHLNDYVLASGGYARAAVRTMVKPDEKVRATWLLFVRVQDVTASLSLAKKLGGQVLLEPRADLFHGKLAVLADPTGAAIGIMEWDESHLKGGD
jgi:predicted enzyme related to lactoylglutathione lyase